MKIMDIIMALITILSVLILAIGAIPSMFVTLYIELYYIPIIVFSSSIFIMLKKNRKDLIKYLVIFHIFCLGTYVSHLLNPGTDDSFSGLGYVFMSSIFASLFTILAGITLIVLFIKILNGKNK